MGMGIDDAARYAAMARRAASGGDAIAACEMARRAASAAVLAVAEARGLSPKSNSLSGALRELGEDGSLARAAAELDSCGEALEGAWAIGAVAAARAVARAEQIVVWARDVIRNASRSGR